MLCPFCNHKETKVIDSRDTNDGKAIRRRRECEKCHKRFSTYEELEIVRLLVKKRNGEKEEYNREKMRFGVEKALEKRPINPEKKERLFSEIENEIYDKAKDNQEILSKEIGRIVLKKLKETDEVAYLRFASVYKSFGSADSFRREMEKLEK